MINNFRLTLAQIDIAWENPAANRYMLQKLAETLKEKTDLIILPETFTTGFTMNAKGLAETMDGPTVNLMKRLSDKINAAICGSLIISEEGKNYNRFVFVKPDGAVSFYNKRHLFSIGGENSSFQAGNQKVIIEYLGWRIAPFICYDLRFPVWSRSHNNVDLMVYVANWPAVRIDVWNILLKARAIENQVYVAGVNRVGTDGNQISYNGESVLIDPRGKSIANSLSPKQSFLTETISMGELLEFRKKFPIVLDADPFGIVD